MSDTPKTPAEMTPQRWATVTLAHARERNKKRGHGAVTITAEELLEKLKETKGSCGCCGTALVLGGGDKYTSPSAERLDNSKGYTPDNVVIACWGCNMTRGDRSVPEYVEFLHDRYFQTVQFYTTLDALEDFDHEG